MPQTVCDDCGASHRENWMGQSTHRCDYKQASREVAERLYEVLVEHREYYTLFDTWITLETRESEFSHTYGVAYDYPNPAITSDAYMILDTFSSDDRRNHPGRHCKVSLSTSTDGYPRINFTTGYLGVAMFHRDVGKDNAQHFVDIDVEVDRD